MQQTRNNFKSTKTQELKTPEEQPMKLIGQRTNTVFTKVINHKWQIATDLTGKFPVTSNRVNKYIFVLYDYYSNCILIRPMNSRSDSEFIWAFTDIHEHLLTRGINPTYMRLDNEASPAFQGELKVNNIDFKLSPPGMHCRNAAEWAISTFKDNFIARLLSTYPDFYMQNWDRLVEQAETTLNLLRPSILNPKLPAYSQLNGTFYYNRTPVAPPGTRTLVHDKPHNRVTWAPHGQ